MNSPKTANTIPLFPLRNDSKSISSAARSICLAFAHDPLIRWLRPGAVPWDHPSLEVTKWQYRRVQRAMLEGMVLGSCSVGDIRGTGSGFPKFGSASAEKTLMEKKKKKVEDQLEVKAKETEEEDAEAKTEIDEDGSEGKADTDNHASDSGAVVFLYPPPSHSSLSWSLYRILMACKLWLLDMLDPVMDREAKTIQRVDKLMAAHEEGISRLRRENLWYLEIIAVHPSLQGRGLGSQVMRATLQQVGNQPVCLECTREDNLGFYEKFGFRVVEKVVLEDGRDEVVYWIMLKE